VILGSPAAKCYSDRTDEASIGSFRTAHATPIGQRLSRSRMCTVPRLDRRAAKPCLLAANKVRDLHVRLALFSLAANYVALADYGDCQRGAPHGDDQDQEK
jgi:hypothetical protein